MKVIVHDTLTAMAGLLGRPPAERAGLLREMLAPIRELIPVPGDVVDIHHQGGGFRVDREDDRYLPALEALSGLPGEIEGLLAAAVGHMRAAVPDAVVPEELQVLFVLGNPDDDYLMRVVGGYYGMGAAPGWLYLIAWPTPDNRARLAHCAVHEFHHQLRHSNVPWEPVVGEHVISEGLAEAFVRELSGPEAMGPWSAAVTGEDFERAYARIVADLDVRGMTAAWVLGDSATVRFGGQPLGIPDLAGYAVGLRLVDEHLARTGMSAAASTVLPRGEILKNG
ncbi:peptidase [Streptosporangiaceae bacterium NEAU-GS5]|nr:peptidase [Streptosporangiaceae bacterium NEAU-GS5]